MGRLCEHTLHKTQCTASTLLRGPENYLHPTERAALKISLLCIQCKRGHGKSDWASFMVELALFYRPFVVVFPTIYVVFPGLYSAIENIDFHGCKIEPDYFSLQPLFDIIQLNSIFYKNTSPNKQSKT